MYLVKVPIGRITLEKGRRRMQLVGGGKDEAGGATFLFLAAFAVSLALAERPALRMLLGTCLWTLLPVSVKITIMT